MPMTRVMPALRARPTLNIAARADVEAHFQNEMDLLERIGVPLIRGDTDRRTVGVRTECLRVARQLAELERTRIGLVPVGKDVSVLPVALQVGLALHDLVGSTVAYVDANVRWPAVADGLGQTADDGLTAFETRWLFESLAILVPPHTASSGDVLPRLRWALEEGSDLFGSMMVDLTGFELIGEMQGAVDMLDGVVLVAGAGVSREDEIVAIYNEFEPQQVIGALLVG